MGATVKLWLAKVRRDDKVGLIPTDDESRAALGRMADGECAEVELIRPRSLQWHRMYFGICREIGKNQDPSRDEASIDYELRVRAGHYDVMVVGRDDMLEKIAKALDAAVAAVRENIRGMERFATLIEGLADMLHERAEKFEVRVPKRIAFAKLDGNQWADLWPSLELAIRETFGEEYLRESQRTGTW
jgi:hypothetical protein